jgi:drug/metabolite transporter (DMT)-like permease
MTASRRRFRSVPWPVRFVALAAIWGLSFLFIRLGIDSFAPLQVTAIRMAVGAATLLTILALTGDRLPRRRRTWARLAFGAVFMNVAPFALFAYGEQRVPSLLAGIWNATTPLMTLPVAVLLLPAERATRSRVTGLVVGFLGVLVVLGAWRGFGEHDVAGDLMCLAAAACYGVGFPYARRFLSDSGDSTVSLAAGQILVGALEATILAVLFTGPPTDVRTEGIVALLALGALGTGVAYILSYSILRDAGATVVSSVTYLLPVVSVVAGVVLLGERLEWNEPVGGLIVVVGALITQDRLSRRPWRPRRLAPAP